MGRRGSRRRDIVGAAALVALLVPIVAAVPAGASAVASTSTTTTSAASASGTTEIVVRLKSPQVHAASVFSSTAQTLPDQRYLLQVQTSQVSSVLARYQADSRVQYASVVHRVHATDVIPNDPCFTGCGPSSPLVVDPDTGASVASNQQYLRTIGAPAAWSVTEGSPNVLVAVLDTGVHIANPDLQGGNIIQGKDECAVDDPGCASNDDQNGHGTHVTGLVGATTNNGLGIASLGWHTKVEMFKVLDAQGGGNTADVNSGIIDAVNSGARVINLSLANDDCRVDPINCGPDPDEQTAIEYALSHGVVIVAAAGNDGDNLPAYPASYPGVLSVAATDNNGVVQPWSQWGGAANIAAPGLNILSTWNHSGNADYAVLSGTSMATPQVSAAAALLFAEHPSLTGAQVTELLESSARPVSPAGHGVTGGLLDVPAALAAATGPAPTTYNGYKLVRADGVAYTFGSIAQFGDLSGVRLNKPIVGEALRTDGLGYWQVASDGGIFAFGRAGFFGSTGSIRLNKPVVGMAATPDGRGYWLVASDGGIFAYGDARFFGSTGSIRLNKPVVGMAATSSGHGYWFVASDGGIFAFGDAGFHGSTGSIRLNQPVVGMAATPSGHGYWFVASDGGIFAFGDAPFYGSTGGNSLAAPVVAMAS